MTDHERMDRETLLKRAAAVAGAVYLAPVLTSAAAGADEPGACDPVACKPGKKGNKKCRKRGGRGCKCNPDTRTCKQVCPCVKQDRRACSPLEQCGTNCGCFLEANGRADVCVNLRTGRCEDFSPCTNDPQGKCPTGQECFLSCCGIALCGDCCVPGAAPAARSAGGAGSLYTSV